MYSPLPRGERKFLGHFLSDALPGRRILSLAIYRAFRKIDLLIAPFADVSLIKFVGEDLGLPSTVRAFADKGFKISKLFETGTMFWCVHGNLLFLQCAKR